MGNWIQGASGGGYDFERQTLFGRYDVGQDLAYPLAGVNRYVRHTNIDWAVAIHSVAVARCIEQMTGSLAQAAAGLLHDAHESILGDIPTPVAWAIDYEKIKALKTEVQYAIEARLGVPAALTPESNKQSVRTADAAALFVEKQLFMAPEPRDWGVPAPPTEWIQTMYFVVMDILAKQEHQDGGYDAFTEEYARLVHPFVTAEGS